MRGKSATNLPQMASWFLWFMVHLLFIDITKGQLVASIDLKPPAH